MKRDGRTARWMAAGCLDATHEVIHVVMKRPEFFFFSVFSSCIPVLPRPFLGVPEKGMTDGSVGYWLGVVFGWSRTAVLNNYLPTYPSFLGLLSSEGGVFLDWFGWFIDDDDDYGNVRFHRQSVSQSVTWLVFSVGLCVEQKRGYSLVG
ncbi:hypothetical protein QBC39DRAFT_357041 [Podospora conica]|nr:hypothetical protein QBC39DRAFT_357041 [Schizothecium conicum]